MMRLGAGLQVAALEAIEKKTAFFEYAGTRYEITHTFEKDKAGYWGSFGAKNDIDIHVYICGDESEVTLNK